MSDLGSLEDLPLDYREALTGNNLVPLWPHMRNLLPHDMPERMTEATLWRYEDLRPLLLQAGELTPIEKAERRVLVLANPGLGLDNVQATPSIYIGMQLILPGEIAPNHRHTPSAARLVVEGEGAYTTVEGEKCPMEKGDLILTPAGLWHEHGHLGKVPVVWLDVLDLPLITRLEVSYATVGEPQKPANVPDSSQTRYRRAGLLPYASLDGGRTDYPLIRYPWAEVRQALMDMAASGGANAPLHLAYVNPETGRECMPVMGFSVLMLRPGETVEPTRRSASAIAHVIEGDGTSEVDGTAVNWTGADTFAVPTHARVSHTNGSAKAPAFLFVADDAPLQRKLGLYEEFNGEGR